MEKLTIKGLLNELSYRMSMEELENLVIEYQETVIEFIIGQQYNFEARGLFLEVCETLRMDKYFNTIAYLINSEDSRVEFEMAYVLFTICNFPEVSVEQKAEALQLGFILRHIQFGEVVKDPMTNVCILMNKVKAIQNYETTPFVRTKEIMNILESLPDTLCQAYGKKYKPTDISAAVILTIITNAVPDVKVEEIISAFCKSRFPKESSGEIREFALRLRAFIYELCGRITDKVLYNALYKAADAIKHYNDRHKENETFSDKYLNFKLLEAVNKQNKSEVPPAMKKAYKVVENFMRKNKQFNDLY